jgi:hypothetical protein
MVCGLANAITNDIYDSIKRNITAYFFHIGEDALILVKKLVVEKDNTL